VHGEVVAFALDERIAEERTDELRVHANRPAHDRCEGVWKLVGTLCEEANRDLVGGEEGEQLEQLRGCRGVALEGLEAELPGGCDRRRVVGRCTRSEEVSLMCEEDSQVGGEGRLGLLDVGRGLLECEW
jgi:hypothetical protein